MASLVERLRGPVGWEAHISPLRTEAADTIELLVEALEGLVRAVNTNELAAAMACHSVASFANVEDALKPALAALSQVRETTPDKRNGE